MKKFVNFLISLLLILDVTLAVITVRSASLASAVPGIGVLMLSVSAVLVIICIVATALKQKVHLPSSRVKVIGVVTAAVLCVSMLCFRFNPVKSPENTPFEDENTTSAPIEENVTEEPEIPVLPASRTEYSPAMTSVTSPDNWEIEWQIFVGNEPVDSYKRDLPIYFGDPEKYFALPGIATFRGNNYRNSATYGTAEVASESFDVTWSHRIGGLGDWGGCGWTGQPLVVQWDNDTKHLMNLYDDKKEKDGLVEVIYATLDGSIHFYDMEDGSKTRDPIYMGMNFKGAGALDPRGYPLLYVGSGVNLGSKTARMYIVSLIDGEILWQQSGSDENAVRGWYAFDSSPLVDAETDTLIWPGENGILYTIRLNTVYDRENGTIAVSPDNIVKANYTSINYNSKGRYLGYEPSASIVGHHLYISENGGLFYCVDLNTMELVWAQDTKDDSNSSPAFEWGEDENGYIYTAPSLHWTASYSGGGTVSIYKLDALSGEIIWEHPIDCYTVEGVSGGIQSSPVMGKDGSDIENLIIYTVSRTPKASQGTLLALDRDTGDVVWEISTGPYSWSSPTAIYTEDGKSYIFTCNSRGRVRLIEGTTGEILCEHFFDETVEASPVVFNNMIVLGSREAVYGFLIS